MNKADLIDSVADATDMSKAEAGRALDAVLNGCLLYTSDAADE